MSNADQPPAGEQAPCEALLRSQPRKLCLPVFELQLASTGVLARRLALIPGQQSWDGGGARAAPEALLGICRVLLPQHEAGWQLAALWQAQGWAVAHVAPEALQLGPCYGLPEGLDLAQGDVEAPVVPLRLVLAVHVHLPPMHACRHGAQRASDASRRPACRHVCFCMGPWGTCSLH